MANFSKLYSIKSTSAPVALSIEVVGSERAQNRGSNLLEFTSSRTLRNGAYSVCATQKTVYDAGSGSSFLMLDLTDANSPEVFSQEAFESKAESIFNSELAALGERLSFRLNECLEQMSEVDHEFEEICNHEYFPKISPTIVRRASIIRRLDRLKHLADLKARKSEFYPRLQRVIDFHSSALTHKRRFETAAKRLKRLKNFEGALAKDLKELGDDWISQYRTLTETKLVSLEKDNAELRGILEDCESIKLAYSEEDSCPERNLLWWLVFSFYLMKEGECTSSTEVG